jgi:hypothetical protein
MVAVCSKSRVEAVAHYEAGVEVAACFEVGVEAAACYDARDEAAACSRPGIEDGRRHDVILGDRRVGESTGSKNCEVW